MPYRRNTTPAMRPKPDLSPVFARAARRMRAGRVKTQAVTDGRRAPAQNDERPQITGPLHGRWWTRTTDLFLIREAL